LDETFTAHDVPMCRQRIDRQEWRDHGGCDLGEIAEWSDRACGMAALRMILLAHHRPVPPLTELLKLARVSDDHAPCQGVLPARQGFPGSRAPMT
jgi:hypothetical protein